MIHTVDVRITLTEPAYNHVLHEYSQKRCLRRYHIQGFEGEGLTEIKLYQYFSNRTTKHYLRITMNPQHVLTGNYDPLALFDEANYQNLADKFDQLMLLITSLKLPPLSQWTVCRIDYAYDAKLNPNNNTGTPADYIELGKRGPLPLCAKLKQEEGWVSCRMENNSVRVNYYSKEQELRSRAYEFDDDIYEQAHNLLRFETQCLSPKLKALARNAGISGRPVCFYMSRDLWLQIISKYGERIIGKQDYYSVLNASMKLRTCRKSHSDKLLRTDEVNNLRDFLKAVDVAGGLSAVKEAWEKQQPIHIHWTKEDKNILLSNQQRRSRMSRLREMGINPAPIPVTMGKGQLVNPLRKFWHEAP